MGLPIARHKGTPVKGRTRCHAGQMNRTEAAYSNYLSMMKSLGVIIDFWWDVMSLWMADSTFYKPDFLVMRAEGTLEIHEVKGFMEDDAWVKLKVMAETYPFPIFVVKKNPGKKGEWTWKQVGLPSKAEAKATPTTTPKATLGWPS
jgi:hypothetical protein